MSNGYDDIENKTKEQSTNDWNWDNNEATTNS